MDGEIKKIRVSWKEEVDIIIPIVGKSYPLNVSGEGCNNATYIGYTQKRGHVFVMGTNQVEDLTAFSTKTCRIQYNDEEKTPA